MNERKGPFDWMKSKLFPEPDPEGEQKDKKKSSLHYIVVLVLLGAGFMLVNDLWKEEQVVSVAKTAVPQEEAKSDVETFGKASSGDINEVMRSYEERYETQLTDALEQMVGIGDVTVVVNVDASERIVYEKNTTTQSQSTNENDPQGGKRSIEDRSSEEQMVLVREGEKELPIVTEKKKPIIRGVLVVATGADNIQIKKWIIESVTRVLDVPMHRVAVMPKKSKGDS